MCRYSGADISIVVNEALMQSVEEECDEFASFSSDESDAVPTSLVDEAAEMQTTPIVTMKDVERSLASSKPTVNDEDLRKLIAFAENFGQTG